MSKSKYKRKLTAILSADVVGYSRLMGNDEEFTIQTLNTYRDLMTTLIEDYSGSVVDAVGDNLLAEFTSVVDAVQCAVAIQTKLKKQNDKLAVSRHMLFRIGINIGDIIQEKDRIYGDGVNIAARIESLADPGSVCISRGAYDHIRNKLDFGYEYLGEHSVKNIRHPVRVYKILMGTEDAGKLIGEKPKPVLKFWVWSTIIAATIVLTLIGYQLFQKITAPDFEPASIEKMAYQLPDKPSIAVLPFDNMSEDKNQEYIADAITDNIITTLSKIHNLFVIARNSSFTYKGKPVKVQQVSEDLGVRYVLEGSVQRSGDRVRVIAQLIDAIDGKHLWSQRYDRHFKDILELQDELASKIAISLRIELVFGEEGELWHKNRPINLQFNEKMFKAASYVFEINKEDNIRAKQLYKECINLEPEYFAAYVMLALTHVGDVHLGLSSSPRESLYKAMKLCEKAITLDESQDSPHNVLGFIYATMGEFDKAIAEGELAITLNPNSATAYNSLGITLTYAGRTKEAIGLFKKGNRLNPLDLGNIFLGNAYRESGQYEEALAEYKKYIKNKPKNILARGVLAMTYALAGRYEEAREAWSEVLKIDPKTSVRKLFKVWPYGPDNLNLKIAAMHKAGILKYPPEEKMEKPSIAVLPFVNMSTDPEQEFFCDGMTENLISVLAQTPQLFVIAGNSTFAYKGKSIDVRQIGQELGAKYVIEGSIQKSNDRYRFVVQLIDTDTGVHIWSERYDREFKDIFKLQDEIALKILKAVGIKFVVAGQPSGNFEGIVDIDSFIILAKLIEYGENPTREGYAWALKNIKEMIISNPEYPYKYDMLAMVHLTGAMNGSCKSNVTCLLKAEDAIERSFSLDANNWFAYQQSGLLFALRKEHDKAILAYKKSIGLNPNSAISYFVIGSVLNYIDKPMEALEYLNKAIRLNPIPPAIYLMSFGVSYRLLDQYEKAIEMYKRAIERQPNYWIAYSGLAIAYGLSGEENNAKKAVKELLKLFPDFSIEYVKKTSPYKKQDQLDRVIEVYRKVGLPEK